MNALITGASGFLGKLIVNNLGNYSVYTLNSVSGDIVCDLKKDVPVLSAYSLVVHAAGKAHSVPKTKSESMDFYNVNVNGTKNLLKGLEQTQKLPEQFVYISSVAVYGLEKGLSINEDAALIAKDPYGESKIQAEKLVEEWCRKNDVICTILRLPLLVGSNPPGNLGSMINGIKRGYYFNIADGRAKKSMVLAEDVANIIPAAAKIGGIYNLTDRYHPNFGELSDWIAKQLGKSTPFSIPAFLAKIIAKSGDMLGSKMPINSRKLSKIMSDLTFDDTKAVKIFGWNPTPVLKGFKIEN
jgi:nucleoside-diphosphate-sugar epimerase